MIHDKFKEAEYWAEKAEQNPKTKEGGVYPVAEALLKATQCETLLDVLVIFFQKYPQLNVSLNLIKI